MFGFSRISFQERPAFRAMRDVMERLGISRSGRKLHSYDLRYDLASFFHINHISQTDIMKGYLVCVV